MDRRLTIKSIGTRGTLFTFHELEGLETCVYVIDGPRHVFVIDTFLGPKSPVMLSDLRQ